MVEKWGDCLKCLIVKYMLDWFIYGQSYVQCTCMHAKDYFYNIHVYYLIHNMYNVGHKPKVFQKHVLNKHLHVQCILKYLAGILCIINLITTMYMYNVHVHCTWYNVHVQCTPKL